MRTLPVLVSVLRGSAVALRLASTKLDSLEHGDSVERVPDFLMRQEDQVRRKAIKVGLQAAGERGNSFEN